MLMTLGWDLTATQLSAVNDPGPPPAGLTLLQADCHVPSADRKVCQIAPPESAARCRVSPVAAQLTAAGADIEDGRVEDGLAQADQPEPVRCRVYQGCPPTSPTTCSRLIEAAAVTMLNRPGSPAVPASSRSTAVVQLPLPERLVCHTWPAPWQRPAASSGSAVT